MNARHTLEVQWAAADAAMQQALQRNALERLLQQRLDELAHDLGSAPIEAVFAWQKDPSADVLRIDGRSLQWLAAPGTEPRADAPRPPAVALAHVLAEHRCAAVLTSLMKQTSRWRHRGPADDTQVDGSAPASLALHVASKAELAQGADQTPPEQITQLMQQGLYEELGLPLPAVAIVEDRELASGQFRVVLNGVRHPPEFGPRAEHMLVGLPASDSTKLTTYGVPGKVLAAPNPANRALQCLAPYDATSLKNITQAGHTVWGPWGYRVLAMVYMIRRHASQLLNDAAVTHLFNHFKGSHPRLAQIALAPTIGFDRMAQVLRGLLDEGVSVRNLPHIARAVVSLRGSTDAEHRGDNIVFTPTDGALLPLDRRATARQLSPDDMLAGVRMALAAAISHQFTGGQSSLFAFLLDPSFEKQAYQSINEDQAAALRLALKHEMEGTGRSGSLPAVLTTAAIRRAVWRAVQLEFPQVPVLAYQELLPTVNITPLSRLNPAG